MKYISKIYKCSSRKVQANRVIREIIKNSYHNVEVHIPKKISEFNYFKAIKQVFKTDKIKIVDKKITYSIFINNNPNEKKINFYIIDNIYDKNQFTFKEDEEHEINYLFDEEDLIQVQELKHLQNTKNSSYTDKEENIKVVHVNNDKIKICFLNLIKKSYKEIDIMSPWLRADICDDKFMAIIEDKLLNGVVVKIAYGIIQHKIDLETEKVAKNMMDRFGIYNNFALNKVNTHYKCLLIDDKYSLSGSINFLSKKGEFIEYYDKSLEGTDLIISRKHTQQKRNIYFNF